MEVSVIPFILTLATLLAACSEPDEQDAESLLTDAGLYRLSVGQLPDPAVAGDTTLTVQIADAATDERLTGSTLTVTPWMPDHGHGVHEAPVVTEDSGEYTVTFAYSMPGTWELTFEVDGALGLDHAVRVVEVQ